jgi:hypothetical protein
MSISMSKIVLLFYIEIYVLLRHGFGHGLSRAAVPIGQASFTTCIQSIASSMQLLESPRI